MKCDENEVMRLYFEENFKLNYIADKVGVNKSTITRILQKSEKYLETKEERKKQNKEKHIKATKEYIKQKRQIKQFKKNYDDLILKEVHNRASIEMSKPNKLSNIAYRDWNKSAFNYNKKYKRYEFKKELGRSYDVPKYIKIDV